MKFIYDFFSEICLIYRRSLILCRFVEFIYNLTVKYDYTTHQSKCDQMKCEIYIIYQILTLRK